MVQRTFASAHAGRRSVLLAACSLLAGCFVSASDGNVAIGIGFGPPPDIQAHPQSLAVRVGQSASFSVAVISAAPVAFQWRRNAVPIPGANDASYTVASAQLADDGGRFSVEVASAYGKSTSREAALAVLATP